MVNSKQKCMVWLFFFVTFQKLFVLEASAIENRGLRLKACFTSFFDKNLWCFFLILFTVDVVRRKAVAIAMKHLQIQSFVTGKFSYFFMTFTTIYIEIDSCKITVMAKYSWYKKKFKPRWFFKKILSNLMIWHTAK